MKPAIIYAIGDVHGMADHLEHMVKYCEADARHDRSRPVFYFLGDIVDRGRQSRRALEIVRDTLARHPGSVLHRGNHDQWFLQAMTMDRNPNKHEWLAQGGVATLASFVGDGVGSDIPFDDAIRMVRDSHPDLVRMVENSRLITNHGRIAFCHAGVYRPIPLDRQVPHDLMWIRGQFLHYVGNDVAVVVVGHTIMQDGPLMSENWIALDTGAYCYDRLSAFKLDPGRRHAAFLVVEGRAGFLEDREVVPRLRDRGLGSAMDRLSEICDGWQVGPR